METKSKRMGGVALLCTAGVLILAGCGNKPPGCADSKTLETIRSILISNVQSFNAENKIAQDDPEKISEPYYKELKAELLNVVSDGYNDQAKMNLCRGTLAVATTTGGKFSSEIAYKIQATQDKANFMIEVASFDQYIFAIVEDAQKDFAVKRYQGDWPGEYRCSGIDGATDGAQGPFTMPVTLHVDASLNTKLERTARGGGVERLQGPLFKGRGPIELNGEGENSPDDKWLVNFQGEVKGMNFAAKGKISTPENRLLRECALNLKLPSRAGRK